MNNWNHLDRVVCGIENHYLSSEKTLFVVCQRARQDLDPQVCSYIAHLARERDPKQTTGLKFMFHVLR